MMDWKDTVMSDNKLRGLSIEFDSDGVEMGRYTLAPFPDLVRNIAKAQAEITWDKAIREVVECLPKGLFVGDLPPEEGKPYQYLGCYILRWGKGDEASIGLGRLSDNEEWQAKLKSWGIKED